MDRNFLDGVYDDFFGKTKDAGSPFADENPDADSKTGVNGEKPEAKPEVKPEIKPEVKPDTTVTPGAGMSSLPETQDLSGALTGGLPDTDEALRFAREALEEAKKLFEGIGQAQKDTGDYLDESLGKMDEIRSEVMKDFGLDNTGLPENQDENRTGAAGETQQAAETQPQESEPEEDPFEKLDSLIGLTTIKKDVRELMDFVSVQKMRNEEGLKSVPVSLHLVFTGNPGTGKTTVARIIAKLYKNIGVLSKGQLVEVDRSGLVAGYVGQTALKTQDKIAEARGGVLFIDEAYALAQKDDAFGQEAIDTILKAMEDYRDDFVVIVAGYTKPMEKFINSNPGLKSRFNKYIEFPDYTVDELEQIFAMNCSKYDYLVEEDAKKHIRELITAAKLEKQENFANAREVRNLFEKVITAQAKRVKGMENPSAADMMTIRMEDLPISPEEMADAASDPQADEMIGTEKNE